MKRTLFSILLLAGMAFSALAADGDKTKIVLIAGKPSHGFGAHDHYAGCMLLAKALNENVPNVNAVVIQNGWPSDPKVFDGAAAILIYSDGGGGHPFMSKLKEVDEIMKKGVGLVCLHYAVEIPKGDGGDAFLRWMGGHFETFWSVNPHWVAQFKEFPKHPVARGVKPFSTNDEWYYHMRFHKEEKGLTPILTAVPPDSTRAGKDGPHSGNPTVRERKGQPEHVGWAYERPDGGRGFGCTGGHVHWNWAQDDFRKCILNAIVWTAKLEVPENGVASKRPTLDEMLLNPDEKIPANLDRAKIEKLMTDFNQPLK